VLKAASHKLHRVKPVSAILLKSVQIASKIPVKRGKKKGKFDEAKPRLSQSLLT